jgi:hypothetical protein
MLGAKSEQSGPGISNRHDEYPGRELDEGKRPAHDDSAHTARERVAEEIMTVERVARQRDEAVTGLDRATVGRDSSSRSAAAHGPTRADLRDRRRLQPFVGSNQAGR